LYSSPNIIRQLKLRRMRCKGHAACTGQERKVYKVLLGKPNGRRLLKRPRSRWEDNINTDLREIGMEMWVGLGSCD